MASYPATRDDCSILLVDSNEYMLDALADLLTTEGYQVHTATGYEDSIATISEGVRPDIAVVEYSLGRKDGIKVIEGIRQTIGDEIHAILLCDYVFKKDIATVNLIRCSVIYYPHDMEKLTQEISKIMLSL